MYVLPVFVVLGNWTDQDIRKITEASKRDKVVHDMVISSEGKCRFAKQWVNMILYPLLKFQEMKMLWRFFCA